MLAFVLIFLLSVIVCVEGFIPTTKLTIVGGSKRYAAASAPLRRNTARRAGPLPEIDERTKEKIDGLVQSNKVLLFMKGNKLFPQW
jgi:hypothetical protein